MTILRRLNHPNIVRYYGTSREGNQLNIFLEYVPGGSIHSLLQRFGHLTEEVIAVYTRQILTGLEYLHRHKVVHRG
jgi:serine/threonine protein kinase